ncbi:hypothetical protein B0H14DRAFT_2715178, partial [Mycena olivaceomarginata]
GLAGRRLRRLGLVDVLAVVAVLVAVPKCGVLLWRRFRHAARPEHVDVLVRDGAEVGEARGPVRMRRRARVAHTEAAGVGAAVGELGERPAGKLLH